MSLRQPACIFLVTIALAWALVVKGGVWPRDWNWSVLAIAAAGVVWWTGQGSRKRPEWLVLALFGLVLFQMIPLPAWLVGILSPSRVPFGVGGWMPLTLAPAHTVEWFLKLSPALLVYLLMREQKGWGAAWPLILLGGLEALLGLAQFALARGAAGADASSTGTYVNRNHYAGLLEMVLPLALMGAVAAWRKAASRWDRKKALVAATALMGIFSAILVAIVTSQSRMGFLAAMLGLVVSAVCWTRVPKWRWVVAVTAVLLAVVFLPTAELIDRFATLRQGDLSADTRMEIWRNTAELIRHFPVTGCGFGAYESALMQYKTAIPSKTVDFAHNDYLQAIAELGVPGFVLGMLLVAKIFTRITRVALDRSRSKRWELAVGLLAAMTAIAAHSLTDFNLHIPANALVAGWICGLAEREGVQAEKA